MMPGEPGLLVPKPVIEMGTIGGTTTTSAGLASDYTWSMIIATMACAVMVVVSAMKGVRRFSFALTYTNLWYVFGKRGRLRVRVHSFTSTNGSNCFVTTSGEFTAELVKEEEELEKQLDSSFPREANVPKATGAGKAGCIVGTEMVFIYNNRTSVFKTGSLARLPEKKPTYREVLCKSIPNSSGSSCLRKNESFSRRAAGAGGELPEWQLGVYRTGDDCDQSFGGNPFVPQWALSLLEPLEIGTVTTLCPRVPLRAGRRAASASALPVRGGDDCYPWDAVMKLRLAGAEKCRSGSTRDGEGEEAFIVPCGVVSGATHTATLRNNVVKLWDNPTRRAVTTLPVSTSSSFLSSFDVNWRREVGVLGDSVGEMSLWDLDRVVCVTSLSTNGGFIGSVHFNALEQSEQDGCVLTFERWGEECGSCVSLWDTRALNGLAARRRVDRKFPSIDGLKFRGYEVVARDGSSMISMHDIRKLNSSPVFEVSADEVRSVGCQGAAEVGQFGQEEEKWWDDAASTVDSTDQDVYCEGDWVAVGVDQEAVKSSPSVLSRCFNALSSAISR